MTANPMPPMIPMSGPTGSMPPQGNSRFKAIDPLRVIRAHVWLLVLSLIVGGVLGTGIWGLLHMFMPGWTSMVQVKVDETIKEVGDVNPDSTNNKAAVELRVMNEVASLRSEEVLRATLERPDVRSTEWFKGYQNDIQDAYKDLSDDVIRVTPVAGTSLITVSATTRNKMDPRKIVDGLISAYMLRQNERANIQSDDTYQVYLQTEKKLERDIDLLSEKIKQYTADHQITSTEMRFNESLQAIGFYSKEYTDVQKELASAKEMYNMLTQRQQTGDTEPAADDLASVNAMPEVSNIQSRIDQYREYQRASILKWGENSYRARDWRHQIDAAEQELELKRQQKLREMQLSRIESYANAISNYEAQLASLEENLATTKAQLTDMQQKLAGYQLMQNQLDELTRQRAENSELISKFNILTRRADSKPVKRYTASTDPELTSPNPKILIPLVTLLVFGITTGLVFLFEMLDQRVKGPGDIKLLNDAELLGTLPDAAEDPSGPTGIERVVEKYPAGLMAEQFRDVRAAIMNKMDRRGYKTLMLVAAQPRSGTSSVVQNLATSLAFHGRNVAIVDANFRRPAQHRLFDLANEAGLVELLRGRRGVDSVIQKVDGLSVSVLTTGQAADAPPELLEGGAFRSVISELESSFDVVLIDAPPALLASDAQLLAKHVDAIVPVVRAVQDKRGMVERMVRRLSGQRADLLGMILNGVQSAAGGYFRKSYRDFYSYRENGSDTGSIDRDRVAEPAKAR